MDGLKKEVDTNDALSDLATKITNPQATLADLKKSFEEGEVL